MPTIDYEYSLGESVRIKAINVIGHIDSLSYNDNGKMFRVVYWNDGTRYSQWVYAWEICGISNYLEVENQNTTPI